MKGKRINYFKYFSLFCAIVVLVFITGCSGTPPAVPIIDSVTYNGNGSTAGTVPVDPLSPYEYGVTVTVLGNTGGLTRINDGGTSYYFTGWNTKADGSGTNQAEGFTFTMGASNVTLYAQWTPYVLRDIGPAGGLIFYDNGSYIPATATVPSWRYLEAALGDQSTGAPWGCFGTSITGTNGLEVGTGEQNTLDIETGCATAGIAARLCTSYEGGGCTDWFLPSKDELNLMYQNLKLFGYGVFVFYYYWSSSENDGFLVSALEAWIQNFNTGAQDYGIKKHTYMVRAVRAF